MNKKSMTLSKSNLSGTTRRRSKYSVVPEKTATATATSKKDKLHGSTKSLTTAAGTGASTRSLDSVASEERKQQENDALVEGQDQFDDDQDASMEHSEPDEARVVFEATTHQQDIYDYLCPPKDEKRPHLIDKERFFVTQCYTFAAGTSSLVNLDRLERAVQQECDEHPYLRMKLTRNELIIDADVKIKYHAKGEMDSSLLCELVYRERVSNGDTSAFLHSWFRDCDVNVLLKWILLTPKAQDCQEKQLVLVASKKICDEASVSLIARRVISSLLGISRSEPITKVDADDATATNSDMTTEEASQDELALQYLARTESRMQTDNLPRACNKVVKNQFCDLRTRPDFYELDKTKMIQDIAASQETVTKLKAQQLTWNNNIIQLESEISVASEKRKQLEESTGRTFLFTDSSTGGSYEINEYSYAALVEVILGQEASSDLVLPLLEKHHISPDALFRLGAAQMTLRQFVSLNEEDREIQGMVVQEGKKIMALVNYVCSRLRECMEERIKLKMNLERAISRGKRELSQARDQSEALEKQIDEHEHHAFKLKSILEQPMEVALIKPAIIPDAEMMIRDSGVPPSYHEVAGYFPITFEDDALLENIEVFIAKLSSGNLRQAEDTSKIFLAAFAVLLKHIVGLESFTMAVLEASHYEMDEEKLQYHALPDIGPWNYVYPMRVDICKPELTLNELSQQHKRVLEQYTDIQYGLSSFQWRNELVRNQVESTQLPVQFKYYQANEWNLLRKRGLTLGDVTRPRDSEYVAGSRVADQVTKEWSLDNEEEFHLKLILVEQDEKVHGGFQFNKKYLDEEKISRWAARYSNILSNIEHAGSRLTIASLIGRFYQQVWTSNGSLGSSDSTTE